MSYMRSPIYVWVGGSCPDDCPSMQLCPNCDENDGLIICNSSDDNAHDCNRPDHLRIHLWAHDNPEEGVGALDSPDDYDIAAGVHMPVSLFDELVLCRFAEMYEEGTLQETAERIRNGTSPVHGNFGSYEILKLLGEDPQEHFKSLTKTD